jgi:TPR repeat protein
MNIALYLFWRVRVPPEFKYWKNAINTIFKAADKKSASALFFLGSAYANGRGVAKDFSRAVDLWKQSSKMGNQDAIRRLTTIGVEVTE